MRTEEKINERIGKLEHIEEITKKEGLFAQRIAELQWVLELFDFDLTYLVKKGKITNRDEKTGCQKHKI